MNLVEAFQTVALYDEDTPPEVRKRIGVAAETLLETLEVLARNHLARMPRTLPVDEGDIIQIVLLRITQGGPRVLDTGPQSEGELRGYLAVSLRNELRGQIRREATRKRAVGDWNASESDRERDRERERRESHSAGQSPEPCSGPASRTEQETLELQERFRELEALVEDTVHPCALRRLQRASARAASEKAFEEVRGLAAGRVSMDDLVQQEDGDTASKEVYERVRERIYQRHTRVRQRLLDAVEALRVDGALPDDLALSVERYISLYLNRQSGT